MGNWNIAGIIFGVVFFFTVFAFILSQLGIDNPYTGQESTVLEVILDFISPF